MALLRALLVLVLLSAPVTARAGMADCGARSEPVASSCHETVPQAPEKSTAVTDCCDWFCAAVAVLPAARVLTRAEALMPPQATTRPALVTLSLVPDDPPPRFAT